MADMGCPISSDGGESSDLAADRISDLPWNVLDIILRKLPLVDAVRTSMLSKDWRYKWLSLSEFVFDSNEFSESMDYTNDGVSVEVFMLEEYGNERFLMPSHLFSFKQLRRLFLGSCTIRIPPSFQKFNFISELNLRDAIISDENLERLIIACPNLQRLSVLAMIGLKDLKIHAPNLNCLLIDYGYKHLLIDSGDDLVVVTIATTFMDADEEPDPDWRSIVQSLSSLNALLNLTLSGDLISLMAVDYGLDKYPLKNNSLASLYIPSVTFECVEVFKIFLSFLTSCPNLENLHFSVESAKGPTLVVGFFKENEGRYSFPKLKSIQMRYDTSMGSTLELLEFVGSHSPNLMEVIIFKDGLLNLTNARINYVRSRLMRCCPQAAVKYVPAGPDCYI